MQAAPVERVIEYDRPVCGQCLAEVSGCCARCGAYQPVVVTHDAAMAAMRARTAFPGEMYPAGRVVGLTGAGLHLAARGVLSQVSR